MVCLNGSFVLVLLVLLLTWLPDVEGDIILACSPSTAPAFSFSLAPVCLVPLAGNRVGTVILASWRNTLVALVLGGP